MAIYISRVSRIRFTRLLAVSIVLLSSVSIISFLVGPLHGHEGMHVFACLWYSISELTLPLLASVLIFAFGVGLFIKLRHKSTLSPLESVYKVLSPEERKIIEILEREGGSVTQKKLSRLTGLSRLKVHRRAHRLAENDIVSIEPHGRTNLITLKKWLDESEKQF